MSADASALRELLSRRLEIVSDLSQKTGALQRLLQARAGAEMDVQRCEMALARETDGVARDLLHEECQEALKRVEESDRGLERCEAEIEAIEAILAEADRAIEAATRAP